MPAIPIQSVPWAVRGGVHSAATARKAHWVACNGRTGIVRAEDMAVTALPTPGAYVRVNPGIANIVSTYPGAHAEAYMVEFATAIDVPVPATTAVSGATRWVIAYVRDPQYQAYTPTSVEDGPYAFVDVLTENEIRGLGSPYIKLGMIEQPASTATITKQMISTGTGIRELSNPRRLSMPLQWNVSSSVRTPRAYELTSILSGQFWPSDTSKGVLSVEIPPWATTCDVSTTVANILVDGKDVTGKVWPQLVNGTPPIRVSAEAGIFDVPNEPSMASAQRFTVLAGSRVAIPQAMRGLYTRVMLLGYKGSNTGARVWLGDGAIVRHELAFEENVEHLLA